MHQKVNRVNFEESHSARWSAIKSSMIFVPFMAIWFSGIYLVFTGNFYKLPDDPAVKIFVGSIFITMVIAGTWTICWHTYISVISLVKGACWKMEISNDNLRISPPNIRLGDSIFLPIKEITQINKEIHLGDGGDYVNWSITTSDGHSTNIDFNHLNPLNYYSLKDFLVNNYQVQYTEKEFG